MLKQSCTGALVRLSSMVGVKLQPPAGWVRPVTTTWALQVDLYV